MLEYILGLFFGANIRKMLQQDVKNTKNSIFFGVDLQWYKKKRQKHESFLRIFIRQKLKSAKIEKVVKIEQKLF